MAAHIVIRIAAALAASALVLAAAGVAGGGGHCGCCPSGDGLLTIHVPAEARVTINGHPTRSTGPTRQYFSRGLQPGYRYPYEILAELDRGDETFRQRKRVVLTAGERAEVWLDPAAPEAKTAAGRPTRAGRRPMRRPPPPVTRLTLHVPADAVVTIGGREMPGQGPVRRFQTRRLRPGDPPEAHTIRVSVERFGQQFAKEVTLTFAPGASEEATFDFSDAERQVFAARDPVRRQEVVRREGGTERTEMAVADGLAWIATQQQPDGRWTLPENAKHGQSDPAATALALLPYLGAGQTHVSGRHRDAVRNGLIWLLKQQKEDGDLRGNSQKNTGMYAQGLGAIVLCEALAMTRDPALREPARRAVDFIVKAQHEGGGWRYEPGEAGDLSVTGWQVMALESARSAGLTVPPETLDRAGKFLDSVQSAGGSRYCYQKGREPTAAMTAEGLLCRVYLGTSPADPQVIEGARWLLDENPPERAEPNIYYWYYGTQLMHQVGGPEWDQWNRQMRELLVDMQAQTGPDGGSWAPRGGHADSGGRLYMTALATCILETYYRHVRIGRPREVIPPSRIAP